MKTSRSLILRTIFLGFILLSTSRSISWADFEQAKNSCDKARLFSAQKQWSEAEKSYREALRSLNGREDTDWAVQAWNGVGASCYRQRRIPEAEEAFLKAIA